MGRATGLFAGGVVALAAVGGAAFYANNYVIPGYIAGDLQKAFEDSYARQDAGGSAQVRVLGAVAVQPQGILSYRVQLPGATATQDEDGATASMTMPESVYDLRIGNWIAAAKYATDPVNELVAELVLAEPLTASLEMQDRNMSADVTLTCNDVTHDVVLKAGRYNVETAADNCLLAGEMGEKPLGESATFNSKVSFTNALSNLNEGQYAGKFNISIDDSEGVLMDAGEAIKGTLSFSNISMGMDYSGLKPGEDHKPGYEIGLDDLPDSMGFSLSAKNGILAIEGQDHIPLASFSVLASVGGLHGDSADVKFGYAYDMGSGAAAIPGEMDKSTCDIHLGNVPVHAISETVPADVRQLQRMGADMRFGAIIIANEVAGIIAEGKSGVGIDLNCAGAQTGVFSYMFQANHSFTGEGLPGEGVLRVRNLDALFAGVAELAGPEINVMLDKFKAASEPAEDGDGLQWRYGIDVQGNLTVNDRPVNLAPGLIP